MSSRSTRFWWLASLFLLSAVTVLANPAFAADQVKNPNLNDSGAVINQSVPPTNPQVKFYGATGQPVIGASSGGTSNVEIGAVYTWLGLKGVTIEAPSLGAVWSRQAKNYVKWTPQSMPLNATIEVYYSRDGGIYWPYQLLLGGRIPVNYGIFTVEAGQLAVSESNKARIYIHCDDPVDVTSEPFTVVDVPPGTVPLYISKDGTTSNLLITWESATYANPQIFVLAGDGSGQYATDGASWKPYSDASFFGQFDASQYSSGALKHLSQIKTGYNEVYYKGLQAGINPTDLSPMPEFSDKTYLATAWGVGKANLTIEPKKATLLGIPFEIDSAKEFFLAQLSGSDHVKILPESADEGGGLDQFEGTAGNLPCPDTFSIIPRDGLWIENLADSIFKITFFGSMLKTDVDAVLNTQGKPWSLTGNPLALSFSANIKIGLDSDVVLPQSSDGSMGLDYFSKSGGTWPSGFSTLNFKQGFWYWGRANQRRWLIDRITPSAQITSL